jgi:hypothetical protein
MSSFALLVHWKDHFSCASPNRLRHTGHPACPLNLWQVQWAARIAGRCEIHKTEFRCRLGVLGENFLEQFDLLIDNDKQLLVLDQTPQLENSLTGEHLQVSRSGISNASHDAA